MDELNRRLLEAAERRDRKARLERQAARLEEEYRRAAGKAEELKRRLEKEQRDVERLESGSLASLLATLFTDRTERLDRERQEAAEALVRYQEARKHAEALRADLEAARAALADMKGADEEYQALLAEKERRIRQERGPEAERLLALDEEEARAMSRAREIAEARAAGRAARSGLARVAELLRSAEGWGTWDMFGGGWLSTAVKHSRIDAAEAELRSVRHDLDVFRRELADVSGVVSVPPVDLSGFARFADYFFDGFLVDWMVLHRIGETRRRVEEAERQVDGLLGWLDEEERAIQGLLADIRRRREAFLTGRTEP